MRLPIRAIFPAVIILYICTSLSFGQGVDLTLTVNPEDIRQTMRHFGSSAAFELNEITDDWSEEGLEGLAQAIFSRETDANGNPLGIGLSSFRVEIGACSKDQGDASQISMERRRADCPLLSDGAYDWSRMDAETYWVEKAYEYDVSAVFAYSNSPPVYYTKNGLACRTNDVPSANLREDAYDDFAEFLATIAQHYADRGTPLHYISPVNEPQWEWICDTQEGTKWHNTEIRDLAIALDSALTNRNLSTQITLSEGGAIDWVYGMNNNPTGGQLRFWDPGNSLYIGDLTTLAPYVAAHGYWTEDTDQRLVNLRQSMYDAIQDIDTSLSWWQSEYSFLGDGYLDGRTNLQDIDYGIFLAKVIHHDLTVGNASAWQYWETFTYGSGAPRYKLVSVSNNETYDIDKTGWALAHYSQFVRPGMVRLGVERSDNATPLQAVDGVMPSAYLNRATGDVVIVIVNYTDQSQSVALELEGVSSPVTLVPYRTTASNNLARQTDEPLGTHTLPARSITTLVAEGAVTSPVFKPGQKAASNPFHNIQLTGGPGNRTLHVSLIPGTKAGLIRLLDLKGNIRAHTVVKSGRTRNAGKSGRTPFAAGSGGNNASLLARGLAGGLYVLEYLSENQSHHRPLMIQ